MKDASAALGRSKQPDEMKGIAEKAVPFSFDRYLSRDPALG